MHTMSLRAFGMQYIVDIENNHYRVVSSHWLCSFDCLCESENFLSTLVLFTLHIRNTTTFWPILNFPSM